MKILHTVEFYHPSVGGMQEVVKQLSERLALMGHDITIATTNLPERKNNIINKVKIAGFNIAGNAVWGLSGDTEKYTDFLLKGDFDIITNFAAQQWASDIAFPLLDRIKSKKVFVPTGFSGLYLPEYKEYFEQMKTWMKKYDMNVFLSNNYRDINFARDNGINEFAIITNGAGKDEFLADTKEIDIRRKLKIPDDYQIILHVGSHTGTKGHSEAIQIFKAAKIKKAVFVIIGNCFGGGCTQSCHRKAKRFGLMPQRLLDRKMLVVASLSREETVAAYKCADLFLFPSNIECSPLVLFECMASRTPFLTSDVGNAVEIIDWSKGGLLLPTIKEVDGSSKVDVPGAVKVLEQVFYNSSLRDSMKESGYRAWQGRFTWEKITRMYENLYKILIRRDDEYTQYS